jgi:predicted DNA-binding transcriptional regulator AlpA
MTETTIGLPCGQNSLQRQITPLVPKRLLRIKEVLRRIPMSASTWWLGVADGKYPRPVKLGKRMVAWLEEDIEQCIDGLLAKANSAEPCLVGTESSNEPNIINTHQRKTAAGAISSLDESTAGHLQREQS